jgi:hypothetical protein
LNILGGSIHAIRKNTEALLMASKEINLKVNPGKTKQILMSRYHHAGNVTTQRQVINPLKEEEFKYWEKP